MKESEVLKSVLNKLDNYELTGDVLWHSRLNSGKIQSKFGGWIQLCRPGTPDIIAIINCMDGTIVVLFIEVKRTGVKKLRFEQQEFFNLMDGNPKILCVVINDVKQLWSAIRKARAL